MRQFTVKEGDKERTVIIAGTPKEMKDKSQMDYLEQAEREKTAEQLKKLPDKPKSDKSKTEISGALKELSEFRRRKREGAIKKYY